MRILISCFAVVLSLFLSGSAGASECDPTSTTIASSPLMSQQPGAVAAAKKLADNVPHSADIIFLGDSLLAGWPMEMRNDFRGKYVWNFSVPGDRTQQVIWRLNTAPVDKLSPSLVVVWIGTNNFGDYGTTACSIFSGIQAIIAKGKELWPSAKTVVLTIAPRGADFHTFGVERLKLNDMIRTLNRPRDNVYALELNDNEITCGAYGDPSRIPACPSPRTSACSYYKPDHLHFERPGYLYLREALAKWGKDNFGSDLFEKN